MWGKSWWRQDVAAKKFRLTLSVCVCVRVGLYVRARAGDTGVVQMWVRTWVSPCSCCSFQVLQVVTQERPCVQVLQVVTFRGRPDVQVLQVVTFRGPGI